MAILLLLLMLGGCITVEQSFQKIDYYTLEYEPPQFETVSTLPFVALIERMRVAPPYNSSKIVFSPAPYKRDAYTYHKWHAHPGNLVTYFLARDIRQAALFQGVFVERARSGVSHVIRGTVDEFFEEDRDGVWKAVLSINITLLKSNAADVTQNILLQKQYRAKEPCQRKNPRALAMAMSEAMSHVSKQITNDIYRLLAPGADKKVP